MSRILNEHKFTYKNVNYIIIKYKLSMIKQNIPNPPYAHATFIDIGNNAIIMEGETITYK